jgi:hypothetical protein
MKQKSQVPTKSRSKEVDLKTLQATPPWEWPKSADKTLQAILTNRATPATDRVIAAELAGDYVVINDQLAKTLMEILGSAAESEEMRATAATSLGPVLEAADTGDFEDPDDVPISDETFVTIQRFLHKLYADESIPKDLRRRILESSVRAAEDWHEAAIKKAYASDDRDWVLTAVFAMRFVPGFGDEILELLKSGDADIHRLAVQAAGSQEVEAALDHVLGLIEHYATTPRPLLLAAIEAVGGLGAQSATVLLSELADSDDEEIAEAAEEVMMMVGDYHHFDEDAFLEEEEEKAPRWIN